MNKNLAIKDILVQSLSQVFFGMLGALLILVILHKTSPTIATVNITELEDSFIKETSSQSISEDDKKKKVIAFAQILNNTIVNLARENNLILVPSQAVISESPDYTGEVAKKVKRGLET